MKILSVFNNKGGVGKTTLTFHLAHALSEMGKKVLIIDADPQCNLSIYAVKDEDLGEIWHTEDRFIDNGFEETKSELQPLAFESLHNSPRSIHYLLKPTEDGVGEIDDLPPPFFLNENLDLVPGRLTLHLYEEKIASRWTDVYRGDPLAIRTITRFRAIAKRYTQEKGYDFVIIDTSPSLGGLNKVIISTVDGFFIPAAPDLFSLYGIRNIGRSLKSWKEEFEIIYQLISKEKRHSFPKEFVKFLGYTLYNAKKYTGENNQWNLAQAHLHYAMSIPSTIREFIPYTLRKDLTEELLDIPIGGEAVMHSHNTFPSVAQKYHVPMWKVPSFLNIDPADANSIRGSKQKYEDTLSAYKSFSEELLERISLICDQTSIPTSTNE
jgi:cellulose biosynthesis protein BcsQ